MARGEGKELRFSVDQIELELALEIRREAAGKGKIEFKVFGSGVELDGKGGQSRSNAHRIKLILKPPAGSGPFQVGDQDAKRPKRPK
ncbi:MAG: trypco2 family protein [Nitrospira sp.]